VKPIVRTSWPIRAPGEPVRRARELRERRKVGAAVAKKKSRAPAPTVQPAAAKREEPQPTKQRLHHEIRRRNESRLETRDSFEGRCCREPAGPAGRARRRGCRAPRDGRREARGKRLPRPAHSTDEEEKRARPHRLRGRCLITNRWAAAIGKPGGDPPPAGPREKGGRSGCNPAEQAGSVSRAFRALPRKHGALLGSAGKSVTSPPRSSLHGVPRKADRDQQSGPESVRPANPRPGQPPSVPAGRRSSPPRRRQRCRRKERPMRAWKLSQSPAGVA